MLSREIKLYSTILGVLLVVSFLSWKADQAPKKIAQATLVAMLDVSPDELSAVSLVQKKEEKSTRVTFEGKGDARTAWVEVTKVGAAATDPPARSAPSSNRFPGGDAATKLVEQFAPLRAVRALGKLDAKQRAELELDDPKLELSVETTRRTHKLKVGGTSFGSQDYYVEDEGGRAWLVKAGSVRPLLNGEGLMERALHELDDKEIATVTIRAGDREAVYEQQQRHDPKGRYWAKPDSKDTHETQLATWLGKTRRLPVLRYPESVPSTVVPAVSLVYRDDGGRELARLEVAANGGQPLVRTERTRQWAESDKVRVDELLGEVDAILR